MDLRRHIEALEAQVDAKGLDVPECPGCLPAQPGSLAGKVVWSEAEVVRCEECGNVLDETGRAIAEHVTVILVRP